MRNENTFEASAEANKPRVMVVDDNESISSLVACMVQATGNADVHCFNSPGEAFKAFAASPASFQLVITDLVMPGMSGIELCRTLQALSPGLDMVLMTGSGLITRSEARQLGFRDLLPKPFPPGALQRALQAAGIFDNNCAAHKVGSRTDEAFAPGTACAAA